MRQITLFATTLALIGCVSTMSGVVRERPDILRHPAVVEIDPAGDGSQVKAFLAAHASGATSGLCQGMLSEELTPSEWCIITQRRRAYLVIDYTNDPLGVDGYRIQPLQFKGGNRFYDAGSRLNIRLLPHPEAGQAQEIRE